MAKKKSGLNKSAAIREYAEKHPQAKPLEIAEALTAEHGEEFKAGQVSTTLYQAKKAAEKQGSSPAPAKKSTQSRKPKSSPSSTNADGTSIEAALAFAKQAGGLEQAEAALAKLREIKESL